tara:strand:- start:7531 stop:7722 length:192 start_codon:yes stop_codon:yes gene_type:complete
MFPGSVSIGNNSAVGDFCYVWSLGGLTIENNVWIGSNSTLFSGVMIGKKFNHGRRFCRDKIKP